MSTFSLRMDYLVTTHETSTAPHGMMQKGMTLTMTSRNETTTGYSKPASLQVVISTLTINKIFSNPSFLTGYSFPNPPCSTGEGFVSGRPNVQRVSVISRNYSQRDEHRSRVNHSSYSGPSGDSVPGPGYGTRGESF